MNLLRNRARLSVLVPFFVLVGCGGGGGGGGASFPNYAATTADSMMLPFVTADGTLKLFDPAAPNATPATIDTELSLPSSFVDTNGEIFPGTSVFLVLAGTYEAASNTLSGAHLRYAFYIKNGTLYRVDLLNTSVHTPAQVSSNTDICAFSGLALDYANSLNTRIAVRVAGVDTTCFNADDAGRYVTLGAANDDPGLAVAADFRIAEWVQAANGSLQRVLVQETVGAEPTAVSYSPDLSSSAPLVVLPNGTFLSSGPDPSRLQQYFRVFGGTAVYRYDATADSLTPVHTFASASGQKHMRADGSYLYFTDGDELYRLAHASTAPQSMLSGGAGFTYAAMELTSNRIVYVYNYGGQFGVETLPKTPGVAGEVLEGPAATEPLLMATSGARVYYNRGVGAASSAVRVNEDGTNKVTLTSAAWAGGLGGPTIDVGAVGRQLRTLMLGRADAMGVATIYGVDAASGATGPALGTIANALGGESSGYGRHVMLNALIQGESADHLDVYYADVPSGGSLKAVATTPDLDDVAP